VPVEIQRFPAGLLELLSIKSGLTPLQLNATLQPVVDLVQFYGLNSRRVVTASNAACAEGAAVVLIPSVTSWSVVFCIEAAVAKTATMTALRMGIMVRRGSQSPPITYFADDLGPFGATETGSVTLSFVPAQPMLIPPNTTLIAIPQIIGTDATANVSVSAEVGDLS
jgi:hypothetical protein